MGPEPRGNDVLGAEWAALTDVGLLRSSNEDDFLAGPVIFAVADGMGGHQAGEVASEIAVSALRRLQESVTTGPVLESSNPELTADDVRGAIGHAHDEIVARAATNPAMAGMGTTLTGIARVDVDGVPHWAVFNVGDSRVYRRGGAEFSQVSVDHSEVQELIDAGMLTPDQARTDFRRNIITRSLGADVRPAPDLWLLPAQAGDQFLICSDGLTNELTDAQIQKILATALTPDDAATVLVTAALAAGGHDNVTVIVVGRGTAGA
ncbi:MAG: serine/threonine-protein phosphatase [Pseudonocardiales bacterium]|nr:serine/threonine-protein phosphatase [Pseudonocardiales bacterium]